MKLFRFGPSGAEKTAVELQDGKRLDVSSFGVKFDGAFLENNGIEKLTLWLNEHHASLPEVDPSVRIGTPLERPGKLICVGLNYKKHAQESGMEIPKEPVLFFKATTAITGPFDSIVIPKNSHKTDWEVELAVVIGKKASYVTQEDAMQYVAGYMVHNDVSEREFQLERGGQWVKGKSCDSFAPLGPVFVTSDEIKNPHILQLWLKVNGEKLQDSNTSDLIFNIPYLVSYISQFMSLEAGDIISTGTPAGVGLGFKPPRYLKPGDQVELGIDGLGIARQTAVAY